MSAVDAPPGIAFAGRAAGELVARAGSLRLARVAFVLIAIASVIAFAIAARGMRYLPNGKELRLVAPLVAIAIGGVCYAVRRARLRIDGAGVRWGWEAFGFRVLKEGLAGATIYKDAIAFRRPNGSPWYLGRRDFDGFERVPGLLRQVGVGFEIVDRRAPFRARLQTYGAALDVLVVLDLVFAGVTLAFALGL